MSKNMTISVLRNASCSRGWLRLVVQVIFGFIIVTSFVLILVMTFGTKNGRNNETPSRCVTSECRVVCRDVSFDGQSENEIVEAAWQADGSCDGILLTLKGTIFNNNTLPPKLLSEIRTDVKELAIIGGNLQHISPASFISPFSNNINVLILEKIQLTIWGPGTFVGLSNLKQLYIKDCKLINITKNALQAVDNTLEFLDIKADIQWNPAYITGSVNLPRLKVVDFASNPFKNILDKSSFAKLRYCTTLFLNSCKITALGKGTFDYLEKIKLLYLNYNYLVTIPDGIFDNIISRRPRIALDNNYWYCRCDDAQMENLMKKDLLMMDPICRYPDINNGMSFSEFYHSCRNKSRDDKSPVHKDMECDNVTKNFTKYVEITHPCYRTYNFTDLPFRVITAENSLDCLVHNSRGYEILSFMIDLIGKNTIFQRNQWLEVKYFVRNNHRSFVEFSSKNSTGKGLLWFRTSCPHEIYCVNSMPEVLRIFESNSHIQYAFCPYILSTGAIDTHTCAVYNIADLETSLDYKKYNALFEYIIISIACLICGATCLYALIHLKPHLLKGNKRIVFVKHKEINALILPPDVPVRRDTITDNKDAMTIYSVSNNSKVVSSLVRSLSYRSSDSNEASYISALQPTDEQLARWRNVESDNKSQHDSLKSDIYKLSSIFDVDSLAYYSLNDIYETPCAVEQGSNTLTCSNGQKKLTIS